MPITQSKSEKFVKKQSPVTRWAIPASILVALGLIMSFVFLPFGILLFVAAMAVVGFNVLRAEEPKDSLTESMGDDPAP